MIEALPLPPRECHTECGDRAHRLREAVFTPHFQSRLRLVWDPLYANQRALRQV